MKILNLNMRNVAKETAIGGSTSSENNQKFAQEEEEIAYTKKQSLFYT